MPRFIDEILVPRSLAMRVRAAAQPGGGEGMMMRWS
jgi:hypothetical protein